jgi:hypothetical protein
MVAVSKVVLCDAERPITNADEEQLYAVHHCSPDVGTGYGDRRLHEEHVRADQLDNHDGRIDDDELDDLRLNDDDPRDVYGEGNGYV